MTGAAKETGLRDFWDAYDSVGVSPFQSGHKEKFLTKLIDSEQTVLFLIPPKFTGKN
jgi:hypothetical protein